MATAESVKAKLQGLIDQSNAATGNADTDLTTAVDTLIAGFGAGGGDSGVETGEIIFSKNPHTFNIPVSSKKSHILIVPQSIKDAFASHITGAAHGCYASDAGGIISVRLNAANNTTETKLQGVSYWVNELDADYGATFSDSTIRVKMYVAPLDGSIAYVWFAW